MFTLSTAAQLPHHFDGANRTTPLHQYRRRITSQACLERSDVPSRIAHSLVPAAERGTEVSVMALS